MIRQEHDVGLINSIVNSAEVRPFVDYSGTQGPLDMAPAVGRCTQTGIVWLSNGVDALAAFPQTGDREYQAHLFFAATCRGRKALDAAREMIEWLKPCADRLWGEVPARHRALLWFIRQLGFHVIDADSFADAKGDVVIVEKDINEA